MNVAADGEHLLERRPVVAEHVAHRAADLAERAAVLERASQDREHVVGSAGAIANLVQAPRHQLGVAIGLERRQPCDLLML